MIGWLAQCFGFGLLLLATLLSMAGLGAATNRAPRHDKGATCASLLLLSLALVFFAGAVAIFGLRG